MPFENLIAGRWTAGGDYRPNRNPSDPDDVIGEYVSADRDRGFRRIVTHDFRRT